MKKSEPIDPTTAEAVLRQRKYLKGRDVTAIGQGPHISKQCNTESRKRVSAPGNICRPLHKSSGLIGLKIKVSRPYLIRLCRCAATKKGKKQLGNHASPGGLLPPNPHSGGRRRSSGQQHGTRTALMSFSWWAATPATASLARIPINSSDPIGPFYFTCGISATYTMQPQHLHSPLQCSEMRS
jgi:hypothetical protein